MVLCTSSRATARIGQQYLQSTYCSVCNDRSSFVQAFVLVLAGRAELKICLIPERRYRIAREDSYEDEAHCVLLIAVQ